MAEETSRSQPAGPAGAVKRKAGVPVWRVGKPDAFLAGAVDTARSALADIARPADIGEHLAAKSEGERVVTHLFESRLPGYRGWQWFVTVARVARSKRATVNEIGLVPSEDAVLAPEWVPWSERVRPEERAAAHADAGEEAQDAGTHDGEGSPSEAGSPATEETAATAETGAAAEVAAEAEAASAPEAAPEGDED
ncbi:DUF3027 domain-containing protein [Sinomonas atrocyanea]